MNDSLKHCINNKEIFNKSNLYIVRKDLNYTLIKTNNLC